MGVNKAELSLSVLQIVLHVHIVLHTAAVHVGGNRVLHIVRHFVLHIVAAVHVGGIKQTISV